MQCGQFKQSYTHHRDTQQEEEIFRKTKRPSSCKLELCVHFSCSETAGRRRGGWGGGERGKKRVYNWVKSWARISLLHKICGRFKSDDHSIPVLHKGVFQILCFCTQEQVHVSIQLYILFGVKGAWSPSQLSQGTKPQAYDQTFKVQCRKRISVFNSSYPIHLKCIQIVGGSRSTPRALGKHANAPQNWV